MSPIDIVTAFVYAPLTNRAECSCGWESKYRLRRGRAGIDAQEHAYKSGCRIDFPLFCYATPGKANR